MLIPIDQISPSPDPVRRHAASIAQDAELQASIAAIGLLAPILVKRQPQDDGYVVVDGDRRLRMARAVGLTKVECALFEEDDAAAMAAAGAAANMVRAPMAPMDQWRAMTRLMDGGFDIDRAASSLGLSERQGRQLDKLGRLHPSVLDLIETTGEMPHSKELAMIASAPQKTQAQALKAKDCVEKWGKETRVHWWRIAQVCAAANQRISRSAARFDVESAQIAWEEDFFAEPGSDEQFTTRDVKGFFRLQLAALRDEVAERAKKKQTMQIVDVDKEGRIELPKGWTGTYSDVSRPKRHETVFATILNNGRVQYLTAVDVQAEKQREKAAAKKSQEKAARNCAGTDPAEDDVEDAGDTTETQPEPQQDDDPVPFTKAGLDLIARAKTQALRKALRGNIIDDSYSALGLLIVALSSRHVRITTDNGYGEVDMRDLAARLISPAGHFEPDTVDLAETAMQAIARMVSVSTQQVPWKRFPAEEWIGAAVGAHEHLARFDTAEMLATAKGAALKPLATELGIKVKKLTEIRAQLVDNAPDWRPDATQFGAPGPDRAAIARDQSDDEEGDDDDAA